MLKEIMFSSLEEIKAACKENNVSIVNDDGTYKSTYEVLNELSQKIQSQKQQK